MANAPESPTEKPEAVGTSSREARQAILKASPHPHTYLPHRLPTLRRTVQVGGVPGELHPLARAQSRAGAVGGGTKPKQGKARPGD